MRFETHEAKVSYIAICRLGGWAPGGVGGIPANFGYIDSHWEATLESASQIFTNVERRGGRCGDDILEAGVGIECETDPNGVLDANREEGVFAPTRMVCHTEPSTEEQHLDTEKVLRTLIHTPADGARPKPIGLFHFQSPGYVGEDNVVVEAYKDRGFQGYVSNVRFSEEEWMLQVSFIKAGESPIWRNIEWFLEFTFYKSAKSSSGMLANSIIQQISRRISAQRGEIPVDLAEEAEEDV
jgi:hypothetical protein